MSNADFSISEMYCGRSQLDNPKQGYLDVEVSENKDIRCKEFRSLDLLLQVEKALQGRTFTLL